MQLNNDTEALLGMLQEAGVKPFYQGSPEDARAAMSQLMSLAVIANERVTVNDYFLPETGVKLRVTCPEVEPRAIMVYYHGGGWVCGSADDYDSVACELATKSSCLVVMVDYRLAPEHPFPIPLSDGWDAVQWVDAHRAELNATGLPLIIAGDSSGGNLAAVLAQRALSNGPAIALQILVYPVIDFDPTRASYTNPDNQMLLTSDDMLWFWNHYAGSSINRLDPQLSPLHSDDVSQLPPAMIISAEYDVLHDENKAYATKLEQAGVTVEHLDVKGEIHGFLGLMGVLASSNMAIDRIALFIDKHL